MKYIVFYTTGDFTGYSDLYKIVEAKSSDEALSTVIESLEYWLDNMKEGYAPFYSNVRVYIISDCLAYSKGKDKKGVL